MEKQFLKNQEKELEKKAESIKKQLQSFAKKDKTLEGDWDTKYPTFDTSSSGGARMEDEAKEVEEYVNLLPVEYSLETRLRDVKDALQKIKEGKYGVCEGCKKPISKERLKAVPEARLCLKCQGK